MEKELADLKENGDRLRTQWQREKEDIQGLQQLKEKIEQVRHEMEGAERSANFEQAAQLKYGTLVELEKQLLETEERLSANRSEQLVKEEVDEEDIAEVVSHWTGVPVSRLMEGEIQKLLNMEERLHLRVVGQDDAITATSNAIRRARAGLQDPNRPLGSFIFLGPTGVGKTELARALAEFLFDDERAMVRIDMSEYMEKHTVSRLIGAPPGYVGYEEGGQLTEAVRRKPYTVVLLDEVEKAHPDVFNVLLQIMDDGRLTDGHGRTVDFKNTLLIMTSNLGTEGLDRPSIGFQKEQMSNSEKQRLKSSIDVALKQTFRPEFLNRIDEIRIFETLTEEQIKQIVDLLMNEVRKRLGDRKITVELTEEVKSWLAEEGFDAAFGARPLRRTIQRHVENPLSKSILEGEFKEGDHILVELKDGALTFGKKK